MLDDTDSTRQPASVVGGASVPSAPAGDEHTLAALAQHLFEDGRLLIRQEVFLARTELEETARQYTRGGAVAVGGAILILLGLSVLLAALVLGLGALLGNRYWLSAFIVGFALASLGALTLYRGKRRLASDSLAPTMTIASARDTARWAREKAARMKGGDVP